ncbi:single-strand DNA-binding protein B [Streptococcus pneumoniae]|nr:single-strand DNA-binding protein B [Streptococcus pneumoniae]
MIGRLTSTPELHKTNNDKSVARATIAVNRRYKDQNGEREADFVNMVLWGRLAETLASYATKGSLISVDGELRTRRFEKNGQMNYVTEVLVTGFQLLESRAQRAMRENNAGQDLADLVLEEEELPYYTRKSFILRYKKIIHLATYTLRKSLQTTLALSTTSKQCFEQPAASFLVCSLIFIEYKH